MYMMASSNGNIFRVTGRLCGECTGQITDTYTGVIIWYLFQTRNWLAYNAIWKRVLSTIWSPVNSPHKVQWRGALMFPLICVWNGWVNNREASDLRLYCAHYDVIVMTLGYQIQHNLLITVPALHISTSFLWCYSFLVCRKYWHNEALSEWLSYVRRHIQMYCRVRNNCVQLTNVPEMYFS